MGRSGSVSRDLGAAAEQRVLEREGFVSVPNGEATWCDARTDTGQPVEIKGCIHERSKGDRTAPGEWWIQRRNHDRLLAERGLYALVVYEPERMRTGGLDVAIVEYGLLPARIVGALIPSWQPLEDHPSGAEERAQLQWPAVFGRPDSVTTGRGGPDV